MKISGEIPEEFIVSAEAAPTVTIRFDFLISSLMRLKLIGDLNNCPQGSFRHSRIE